MGQLLIKQSTGLRRWVTPIAPNGSIKTGLVVGDFTILLVAPNDTTTTGITPVASTGATNSWIVDIPSAFLITNGVGSYYLRVVISAAGPTYNAVHADMILVTQNLLDDLAADIADVPTQQEVRDAMALSTAATINAGSIDDKLAPIYTAKADFVDDNFAATDRYLIAWYKNAVPLTAGITSPTITVVRASDAVVLVSAAPMTQVGATGQYRYDATGAERTVSGVIYTVTFAATIDSSTRSWKRQIGRDT